MSGSTIRLEPWLQGPTGFGQGGWTAQRLAVACGEPVTVALRRPIPLETDMGVERVDEAWHLVAAGEPEPIMVATPWVADVPDTEPVSIPDAALAGARFPFPEHPVPDCFSCGIASPTMHVQSGPLPDGRWATDWVAPSWSRLPDGTADPGTLWAAVDCAQGWYAGAGDSDKRWLTVQLAVEQLAPVEAGASYAIVSWAGDYDDGWDGRKRGTCGAIFDAAGTCVARSRAFWVSITT